MPIDDSPRRRPAKKAAAKTAGPAKKTAKKAAANRSVPAKKVAAKKRGAAKKVAAKKVVPDRAVPDRAVPDRAMPRSPSVPVTPLGPAPSPRVPAELGSGVAKRGIVVAIIAVFAALATVRGRGKRWSLAVLGAALVAALVLGQPDGRS
ncbi:MAG: hypothetical protein ACR2HY_10160 [Acidimicrobiales bacterium]